jgi:sugar phosphate isomerase/epimerase
MNDDVSTGRRALLKASLGIAAVATAPTLLGCATRKPFFEKHQLSIGLQLYTLGDAPQKDLEGTLARVAAIGYREIELPGLRTGDAARMRAAADKAGLAVTSVHLGATATTQGMLTVQDDPAMLAAELRILNCRDAVLPFPLLPTIKAEPGEDMVTAMRRAFRTSTDHWKRTAALLNERGAALQREGLSLSYHNHDLEFLPVADTRGWDVLMAELDPTLVSFELDVGWLVAGGEDPIAFVEDLAGRVRHLHVKDLHAPVEPREALKMESTEVGSGVIHWSTLLPAAYRAGVRHFYVEQEPPFTVDRFEAVARSFAYLKQLQEQGQ